MDIEQKHGDSQEKEHGPERSWDQRPSDILDRELEQREPRSRDKEPAQIEANMDDLTERVFNLCPHTLERLARANH